MKELADLVDGKRVALVGNAQSLLSEGKGAEIDAHDVVIRFNMGVPQLIPQVGKRCDVWVTAKRFPNVDRSRFRLIVFMKLTEMGDYEWGLVENEGHDTPRIRWPKELADECIAFCGCDPGTGLRILWWLKKKASPASVSIYGMDCWETPSTWSGRRNTPNHNPTREREVIQELCRP